MLYKKYHRFYVRQFKKGAWFRYKDYNNVYKDIVEREPYYDGRYWRRNIRITGSKNDLFLIFPSGQLVEVEIIKRDAVQEIS